MEKVYVINADMLHQYDKENNIIASWNEKLGIWLVTPQYDKCKIVYPVDNEGRMEFPEAVHSDKLKSQVDMYPEVYITMSYNNDGDEPVFDTRLFTDGNISKEDAIELYGKSYFSNLRTKYKNVGLSLFYNDTLIWTQKTK